MSESAQILHSRTRQGARCQRRPLPAHPPCAAGLKRYFHSKRGEGLLSAQGLRILSFACDLAIDSQQPLVGSQTAGHTQPLARSCIAFASLQRQVLAACRRIDPERKGADTQQGLAQGWPVARPDSPLPKPPPVQDIWTVAEQEAVGKYRIK